MTDYGILIHGGAGSFVKRPSHDLEVRRRVLRKSIDSGYRLLKRGKSAVESVEASIRILEDSMVFNAGSGASLTLEGEVSADAAIMTGDLRCGSIGGMNLVKNPITLARKVMEKSDHVLIVGNENLRKFAISIGLKLQELNPAPSRTRQYRVDIAKMKNGKLDGWPRNIRLLKGYSLEKGRLPPEKSGTVGAVAIDQRGSLCAGVSTGGRWLKLPGRIGDSALVGAGLYARNSAGAACATGIGEDIIRVGLCRSVCDFMRMGADAQSACDSAINSLDSDIGTGIAGVIAVDSHGHFGSARNTEMMPVAFLSSSNMRARVAFLPGEKVNFTNLENKQQQRSKPS